MGWYSDFYIFIKIPNIHASQLYQLVKNLDKNIIKNLLSDFNDSNPNASNYFFDEWCGLGNLKYYDPHDILPGNEFVTNIIKLFKTEETKEYDLANCVLLSTNMKKGVLRDLQFFVKLLNSVLNNEKIHFEYIVADFYPEDAYAYMQNEEFNNNNMIIINNMVSK